MWPRARELPTRLARRTHSQRPPRCRCADLSAAGHCHRHSSARLSLNLGSGGGVGAVSASARLGPVHTHLLRPALAARAPLASASAPELDAFTALLRSSSSSSSVVASTVPDVLQAPARPLRLQITVPTLRRAGINKNPLVKTRPRVAVSVQAASKEVECQLPMDMECGCKTRRLKEQQEQAALEAAAAKQQAAQAQAAQVEAQAQAQAAQTQAQAQAQAAQAAQTQAAVVVTRSSALAVAPLPTPGMLPVLGKTSFHRRHLPQDCIAFSSPEGRKLFTEALNSPTNYMQIYFPLAEQFITQAEPAYCGLATLAMCLNALQIDPGRLWKGPWRWFSEELFDCCTSLAVAKEKGISMSEFICLARCNGVLTDDVRATDDFSLEQFRDIVQRSCATSSEIVVLNYSRKVLGQTGDGHFSPIGGYHAERDMVLLMDVARFKYPPHWVRLSLVYEAMQRLDASIGLPRGLVVLKESAHATGPTLVKQQLFHADEHSTAEIKPAPSPCCNSAAAVEAARRVSALFKN